LANLAGDDEVLHRRQVLIALDSSMPSLKDKTIIVTGASAGIGSAISLRLAGEGARVIVAARRQQRLDELKHEIESSGGRALAVSCDVNDEADRSRLVNETMNAFGRIDGLINNAGYGQRGPIELVSVNDIRRNFETNLFSLIALTQLVIPIMRSQKSGRIVNIGSVAGRIARPLSSVYDATKHALEAISDGLRGELSSFGIQVVLIEPGFITTEFLSVANNNAKEIIENAGPYQATMERQSNATERIRRFAGQPDDIAEVVYKALTATRPKARYAAPGHAKFALALKRTLPQRLFDYVLNR
jgi:short-subunit dehydrogenase